MTTTLDADELQVSLYTFVHSPQSLTLFVPDSAVSDLHQRLKLTRFPEELAGCGKALGPPLADLTRLIAQWKDRYDWRQRETEINKLSMFTRPIVVDGSGALDIHFMHQKSAVEGAIPLLFVHGCSSSLLPISQRTN
jgi:hypothetical protein